MNEYEAVVVGAGLGGLSAAACLARAGKKVLLVERQDGVGGNARAFQRGAYTFDPAIHVTAHGFNIEFLDFYLASLGIADRLDLIRAKENSAVHIAGAQFTLPTGVEALAEYLCEQFPGDADGIRAFIGVCAEATRESQAPPPRVATKDLDALMAALPTLFKYRTATVADVLDEFLTDPEAKAVCGAQWPYLGLPPSRQSFMSYSGAWMALVDPGPLYPRGSFQALADALAGAVTESGGTVRLAAEVSSIVVEDGRATGVVLDGEEVVRAPIVISNADAKLTFERLVGVEHLPDRLVRRLGRMKPSLSAFLLYSATTIDPSAFGIAHETFVYRHWDHDRSYADLQEGGIGGMWFSVPTQHDPALAPDGEHIVIFTSLMPYDIGEPWETAKPRYTAMMIEEVEAHIPGFSGSTTFLDSATPATFERYTLAHRGAAYGWENTPSQTIPKRLDARTPVAGLWLAGHWSHPGTGSVRCLLSGVQAAAAIMEMQDPFELLGSLGVHGG
ncbi:MAG: NAD(P)/FAD-dependent oxidoreductase [Solirubrobacteraceae bacterium]